MVSCGKSTHVMLRLNVVLINWYLVTHWNVSYRRNHVIYWHLMTCNRDLILNLHILLIVDIMVMSWLNVMRT